VIIDTKSLDRQFLLFGELSAIIDAPVEPKEILARAWEVLRNALQVQVGGAFLTEDGALLLVTQSGLDGYAEQLSRLVGFLPSRSSDSLSLLKAKEIANSPLGAALEAAHCPAIFTLPLEAHGRTWGYLFFEASQTIPWGQYFWELLSRLIGLGVANAQLRQEMERQLRQSQTIYEISRAFVATTDLDELLNLIVHSAVETIEKADNCVLHLFDEETGELLPRALSFVGSVPAEKRGKSRMRIGQGVAGLALELGQVLNVPDVSHDPRFIRVNCSRPFASMLAAPLKLGDRRIGTLSVDSKEPHAFTSTDERLLMTLATQAAAAIENARLVRDLQQSIHDLKATQAQLIQSEKLSAIGQLIAGVAHELNNPLTAVMGYTQLLQATESLDEQVLQDLNKIYLQAQRAAKIVQNLLTFARQHKAERQLIDVNEVLERTLELRLYQLRVENIEVTKKLAPGSLSTMADPNQLQQVFLNLINNAQDAMVEYRGGGHLLITTERKDDKILIKFSDDGPGLSEEVKKHLFEPFFTTKEVGKGTGLGLSICFGIVSQYGGRIWAESEEGKGATFIVELPVAQGDALFEEQETLEAPPPLPKHKSVLIVEDEEEVANILVRILSQDGHQVLVAHDGNQALEHLARAHSEGIHFDLIISDIKMPGLGGFELYKHIQEKEPHLTEKIIFITGDTMNVNTQRFLQENHLPYLAKPFTIHEFRQVTAQMFEK